MDELKLDDPANIAGMSFLIDTAGSAPGINVQALEKGIMGGTIASAGPTNIAKEFENELSHMDGGGKQYQFVEPGGMKTFERPSLTPSKYTKGGQYDVDALLRDLDSNQFDTAETAQPAAWTAPNIPYGASAPGNFDAFDPFALPPVAAADPFVTNEERRQNVIGRVFDNMEGPTQDIGFEIQQEKEEDEKARRLENIDYLRNSLEADGEDMTKISSVSHASKLSDICSVEKLLTLKNDRKRCCTFAEEFIMMGAHGVEWLFDGKKSYFGRKPDMTDWSKSVQTKLRRMRPDTSAVVQKLMKNKGLGSGTRIVLELVPNAFLYSRMRKNQHKETIVSDDEYSRAINSIRDHEGK